MPGAAGVWRDLTNNVNELAGNLTRQVRAIGDVATAVTKGDLTQSINVEARGEIALLKDNVNQMIRTLAETTQAQPGAGLAQDQRRALHPHAAGAARPRRPLRDKIRQRAGRARERAPRRRST